MEVIDCSLNQTSKECDFGEVAFCTSTLPANPFLAGSGLGNPSEVLGSGRSSVLILAPSWRPGPVVNAAFQGDGQGRFCALMENGLCLGLPDFWEEILVRKPRKR